jgi:hypothetical protein
MEYWPPPPQIETVLDKRIRKNKPEYLIKWTGQPSYDNTWESLNTLNSIKTDQGKIKEFEMMRTSSFQGGDNVTIPPKTVPHHTPGTIW